MGCIFKSKVSTVVKTIDWYIKLMEYILVYKVFIDVKVSVKSF